MNVVGSALCQTIHKQLLYFSPLIALSLLFAACSFPGKSREPATKDGRVYLSTPECCPLFETLIDPYLRGSGAPPKDSPLEDKIIWIAEQGGEGAKQLGNFAYAQIEAWAAERKARSRSSQPERYDAIVVGGGYLSAALHCNFARSQRSHSQCPATAGERGNGLLTITSKLGGPMVRYGKTFFFNSIEDKNDPSKTQHPFYGCPIQIRSFLHNDRFLQGRGDEVYPIARVAGDVALLNTVLAGGSYATSSEASRVVERAGRDEAAYGVVLKQQQQVFAEAPHVVLIGGAGKPTLEGIDVDPKVHDMKPGLQSAEAFLSEVAENVEGGRNTVRQEERVGILGQGDNASIVIEYFEGKGPNEAYINATRPESPLTLAPLTSYGSKDISTADTFEASLTDRNKDRYREVTKAIKTKRLIPIQGRVSAIQVVTLPGANPQRKLAIVLEGQDAAGNPFLCSNTNQDFCFDRIIAATGYDLQRSVSSFRPNVQAADLPPLPQWIQELQPNSGSAANFIVPHNLLPVYGHAQDEPLAKFTQHSQSTGPYASSVYRVFWPELYDFAPKTSAGQQVGKKLGTLGLYLKEATAR